MAISIRLDERDEKLFRNYAESNNMSISELVRNAVLEKIEDEYDLALYYEALAEYEKNPVSYSLDEVRQRLGLD